MILSFTLIIPSSCLPVVQFNASVESHTRLRACLHHASQAFALHLRASDIEGSLEMPTASTRYGVSTVLSS